LTESDFKNHVKIIILNRPIVFLFLLVFSANLFAQNPHGADQKMSCVACHNSAGWEIEAKFWQDFDPAKPGVSKMTGIEVPFDSLRFHHGKTNFELEGQHKNVDCRACHATLIFSEAEDNCISCHADMHQQTVGTDCARCHTSNNWMVDNVTDLHQDNGFPLTGVHQALDCASCHQSASTLQFERIGNDCASCHLTDYNATTNPNHKQAGFSTDCLECHDLLTSGWGTTKVSHDFFPLTKGHEISDCAKCHVGGDYSSTPTNCFACHQPDYQSAVEPNHVQANFSNDCASCHTTDLDWMPAKYTEHDAAYFPIYSGKHNGQWSKCTDCHQNPANYAEFSCTNCHINPETDNGHTAVNGYIYESSACLSCHPTGDGDVAFDHNSTSFPLSGAHLSVDCNQCHTNGYAGTPTECASCHTTDFNQAANPNHVALGIPTDCAMCHTTAPGWAPASFPIHSNYYALNGAHASIANDCATCHNGNYNSTPNTCAGCHIPDYNATTSPNHATAQFPTDCAACHSETAWMPSNFDHDVIYPFTGAHIAIKDDCNACHHGNFTNTPNTCAGCHTTDFNQTTNPNHVALAIPTDCAMCHTTAPGWEPAAFPIHDNYYALNGAHAAIANDCATCHNGNYNSTPNTCAGCHTPEYNATTSPNHATAQFPTDCAACHSETAWMPSNFDHDVIYPFTGAHIAIKDDCNACHHGNFTNTPNTCAGCHTTDFNQTTNPNHVALAIPTDCAMCHTTAPGWEPAAFPIHNNYYALNGAHAAIANDCATCHNGNYNSTPNTCAGCHTPEYNGTTSPNHVAAQFPTDCAACHSETAWAPSSFDHNTIYPFTGAHIAIKDDCALCHPGGNYTNTPNTCAGCHTTDFNQTTNPNHGALNLPTDCAMCHTTAPGWEPASFPIHNNYYALNGAHAAIANDCASCHNGNYNSTPNTCAGCHTPDYNGTTDPNHVALQFPTDCATCHSESAWAPSTFDHNSFYPLNGAHAAIANDCNACHQGNYVNTPNTCAGCHTPDYNGTTDPNHVALQFPTDCATCHTETAWEPSTFDHNSFYPLNGAHAAIANDCNACHHGDYQNTPNTCIGCHTPDYNGVVDPNHVTAQFPTDCTTCHSETAWTPTTFDHSAIYPFTGAHVAIADDCVACHHGDYQNTPNTCAGCHTPDYNSSLNPNHVALAIPTDCAMCHTTAPGWAPATFPIHNNYYALNGAHAGIANDCATCHNGDYNNTPNTCVACHQADYNGTTNPNHVTAQFPTDCATCHTETAWTPTTFDHNSVYPFTGAHIPIKDDCNACHHGDYNNTPNTCAGCHTPDYDASLNPNHVALAIPTDCAMCHTTVAGWEPATFPIHNNYYALNGAHIAIANDCATCHNGDYNNTPNTCVGCHQADYNGTNNPNHITAQFPTDCAVCHSETAWVPSTFDHSTIYPFTGAHIAIANDCDACHHGDYNNTPNTCEGCHTPAYNASLNPNHAALVIPMDCAMCHTTAPGWEPATFPIHNNYYPLNGAHAGISNDCANCHHGDYNNTPNTCVGCHQADYNGAADPNHVSNQFPTDCATCHTETAWVPSTFDHSTIYPFTGAHIAIADDCNACHHGDYNNTPNTCAGCHTPDYNASLNPNHIALVIPTDCAMCHTTAPGWEPATFPIHDNYYPLNGAHAGIANDCAACHNGDYNNTPNTCVGCHQADYDGAADPNHPANQLPTTCQDCHSETAWVPSTFDHSTTYPFTGAHIPIANDCALCHPGGNYNNTPNTCAGCHTPDYNASVNPNHTALMIPTDCAMCHTTAVDWEPATFSIHNNYWPLNGAHQAASCDDCHNGNYNNTPVTCVGCHQADYNGAMDPNHTANQLPTTCQDCHTETAWVPSTFDHSSVYPFTGAHIPIADNCALCHPGGNYNNTPNTCAGCHTPDYNASVNPNHIALTIPTDCDMCHTTAPDWEPATFPIHDNYYQLNGAHTSVGCADCHNGDYNNTPNTCNGCHNDDYLGTNNPNHAQVPFPVTCQDCHTEDTWIPSFWDHSTWPLTGAHQNATCADCHINGNYNNTPNTCLGCHQTDYNNANNPDHSAAQFPTTCQDCHTTSAWVPSTWDHDQQYFPIFSGNHNNEWDQCVDCHTTPGNYALFSCIDCHEHDDPVDMADHHQGVPGYQYSSPACYSCHPDGSD
jgi:hypothetical protein